ncbi:MULTISPECIES: hypothetical protein [Pseudoalteromonas]|uniref:Uncharacterized protein n=1 Tax=Pseudoalteromonas luteoviolacea (strain 2ta16) TaxID=1353533 RepID=V4HS22_PSEL2|nr:MULTISPECIES: hypothetical protein [Pseudoalteromonas]ESP93625.1 hypothetical protein PL2TA16_03011 [Pseudoalteromonas luteoviolacea 2ta16]KZN42415.1 hypothetical protein N483_12905 [Pseudoalteromonas luteoviolacea NCIMB 1944]MCG7547089.1 hypothetical protein [Pseudoalteromonas sp. Of7M-16]
MMVLLIMAALLFSGVSVYCLCKANYCACQRAGQCDNPVNHYWLGAIIAALLALACCCFALHSEKGTLLWIVLMSSCLAGALLSAKVQKLKRCKQAKQANSLATDGIN